MEQTMDLAGASRDVPAGAGATLEEVLADQRELLEGVHRLAHEAVMALLDHDLRTVRERLQRLERIA